MIQRLAADDDTELPFEAHNDFNGVHRVECNVFDQRKISRYVFGDDPLEREPLNQNLPDATVELVRIHDEKFT